MFVFINNTQFHLFSIKHNKIPFKHNTYGYRIVSLYSGNKHGSTRKNKWIFFWERNEYSNLRVFRILIWISFVKILLFRHFAIPSTFMPSGLRSCLENAILPWYQNRPFHELQWFWIWLNSIPVCSIDQQPRPTHLSQ